MGSSFSSTFLSSLFRCIRGRATTFPGTTRRKWVTSCTFTPRREPWSPGKTPCLGLSPRAHLMVSDFCGILCKVFVKVCIRLVSVKKCLGNWLNSLPSSGLPCSSHTVALHCSTQSFQWTTLPSIQCHFTCRTVGVRHTCGGGGVRPLVLPRCCLS